MFNTEQFREIIIRVLAKLDTKLVDEVSIILLLGTCAQESLYGHYFTQLDNGPARGFFQMEPVTFEDIKKIYSERYPYVRTIEFDDLRKLYRH